MVGCPCCFWSSDEARIGGGDNLFISEVECKRESQGERGCVHGYQSGMLNCFIHRVVKGKFSRLSVLKPCTF
jgi:hypothetical protein